MLIAYFVLISKSSMTDSMNFGPEWLRNLSSEGSSTGGSAGGAKYQLADHRYGREEMLALFEKGLPAPSSLTSFSTLYSEQQLTPLALLPQSEEERSWQSRPIPPGTLGRGRGNSLDRGRISRGRGGYQSYARPGYDGSGGWGNGEHSEWSPRKEYNRTSSVDNWRRNRGGDEEDGWRSRSGNLEKWGRSASWRESGDNADDRGGAPDRMNRGSWHEGPRGPPHRRQWGDSEDHLPEWATENPSESGGSFDASGAFHGSDDEQREQKGNKKEPPLQKSASVSNMSDKLHQTNSQPLKSTSLKQTTQELPEKHHKEEIIQQEEEKPDEKEPVIKETANAPKKMDKSALEPEKDPPKTDKSKVDVRETNAPVTASKADDNLRSSNRVDEDFDRLQEDLVQKLVVEEDLPNKQNLDNFGLGSGHGAAHPPPNLVPPVQNSWFYQDPQGDLQGPFTSTEMAEWHKAGYFSNALLVKRQCDESFYRLGDLVSLCGGNPFLSPKPIPPLKSDVSTNVTKQLELLQRQLALNQATAMRTALGQNEFWANLNVLQQREFLAQHMIPQPQMAPDLRYLQAASNPLMQMFNQMQQTNKIPGQPVTDKPTPPIPPQLDPLQTFIQQMGGTLPTIPNPLQTPGTARVGGGLPPNNNGLPPNLHAPPAGLSYPNIPLAAAAAAAAVAATSSIPSVGVGMPGIPPTAVPAPGNVPHNLPPRPNPLGAVDPLSSSGASTENDPIKSLLRQLQNNKPQQPTAQTAPMDALWQSNQQFGGVPPKSNAQSQWLPQQPSNDASSTSVWDLQGSMTVPPVSASSPAVHDVVPPNFNDTEREKEFSDKKKRQKEEENAKKAKEEKEREKARELEEQKKKRELEEKKRKEEQRKQEAEKKAAEEKRKKEEEKIRKELEKAKKEAEEKRLKELDEKRRLKEQRKAEEEAKKRSEEKRQQDEERARQEAREREEFLRRQQEEKARHENSIRVSRAAPWSQASPAPATGTSLAEIQRLEREKKQEQLLQMQKQQQQQMLQEQQQLCSEKVPASSMPLGWAKKPPVTKKIKSLAEIQMEEQERLVKQATEARLAQIKEKETNPSTFVNASAWKGISWAIAASQWNTSGFWEETTTPKPPTQTKPSSANAKNMVANNQSKQTSSKQSKSKAKKEEQQVMKLFGTSGGSTGGNNKQDEFMEWCTKTLCKIEASIDIETFVEFLRNVESALEVRDYCKEYLGDSPSTSHFATQFLEKRRLTKPKNTTQKDDMSSPAPAITPSSHLTDFQEVKGKGKKTKKSKMTKLDKSILGFSVTAAPDRINVGDRDYVEN